jgi:tRNA (guanine-N7-)-methyltransferase
LGCGKGEYSIGLAKAFPEKNFIGIDIKGARFWFGAKEAVEKNLTNVAFLRTQIELVDHFFETDEVDEIWITFPDPQIKYRRTKHRMTHPDFLDRYKKILKNDGIMHLKTDSEFLHGYTLGLLQGQNREILFANHDIYGAPEFDPETPLLREIKTYYETLFESKGKTITYIKFKI